MKYAVTLLHREYLYLTQYVDINGSETLEVTLYLDKLDESDIQSENHFGLFKKTAGSGGQ